MIAVTSETSPLAKSDDYLAAFFMDDYIGGRYSSTSAVGGAVLSLAFGPEVFAQFLDGAAAEDALSKNKDRFRYQVLSKIGLGRREIQQTVFRQLSGYYLCPAILSAVISGIIAVYMGAGFNFYTGVSTPVLQYFAISFALFFGVYIVYFGATYVGFIRNIEE